MIPSIIGSILFSTVVVLYILLALGKPYGEFAMGGQHKVLPEKERIKCIISILVQLFAIWILLQGGGAIQLGLPYKFVKVACYFFAVYLSLNMALNLLSKSQKEKRIMAPLSAAIAVCFWLTAFSFPSSKISSGAEEGYQIIGKIDGIQKGKLILAKLDLVTNEAVYVDSTEISDGAFIFEGVVASPYLHTLIFTDTEEKIHFFLENSVIQISGNNEDVENANITGSREDSLFHFFELDDIFDRRKGMEIMLAYPDYCFSAFTAYYQFQIHNIHADTLDKIMLGFTDPVKQSDYYKHLNDLYKRLKRVAISQPAPAFSIPDTAGNIVHLDDFKGSYVLIDFWASWCAPCRAANAHLVEVYEQFSDKNFTIVGISVDKDEDRWKNAIESDQLPWFNVSNLEGWDAVSEVYGVEAIPQNFLLDKAGIIIDKNIEPEHLMERLKKIDDL